MFTQRPLTILLNVHPTTPHNSIQRIFRIPSFGCITRLLLQFRVYCILESSYERPNPRKASRAIMSSLETHGHRTGAPDDGITRTGTLWSAFAHIITGIIGAGVLSLTWSVAQLGWIAGPCLLLLFAVITQVSASLMADCYKFPDPVEGPNRNPTYMDSVRNILGKRRVLMCGAVQLVYFYGICVAYVITSSISIRAIRRSNCYHKQGHEASCQYSEKQIMIAFGVAQLILSQIPNFHKLTGLSTVAAIMSFCYATVGFGLGLAKVIAHGKIRGTLGGIATAKSISTPAQKVWRILQATADIAFSFPYTPFVLEIQDTLKPNPPENVTMKKASLMAVSAQTILYMLCAFLGYAAFGEDAPGNLLTGFGFYEPFWLVDFANACIVVHLLGAYQVFAQPIFASVETWIMKKWGHRHTKVIQQEYQLAIAGWRSEWFKFNIFRLCWRSLFVASTVALAISIPLFNDVLGILGAIVFWPLVVHLPLEMYAVRAHVKTWTKRWWFLQSLSGLALLVTLATSAACIEGLIKDSRS